ncbi:MAG: integrase core domain-containing protein [Bdellovibrionales bacterium]|nr:integrase core domain-containing protein [Bdellovibrionales bacterium]
MKSPVKCGRFKNQSPVEMGGQEHPESNGMSKAFVATLKRDYIYTSDCNSAQDIMKLFKNWIEDYNTVAPHSGLGMRSPVEYRKLMDRVVSLKWGSRTNLIIL